MSNYIQNPWSDEAWAAILPFIEAGGRAMEFGPGHIVFSDDNYEDANIRWCLEECDRVLAGKESDCSPTEVKACRDALQALLKVPEDRRIAEICQEEEE